MTTANEYQLAITREASKAIRTLPLRTKTVILQIIENFKLNPFPYGYVKLKGYKNTYRVRSRDYRLVYDVNPTDKVVTIIRVAHRKEVYKS